MAEGGIQLKLTIVETAGFGDQLDKDKRLVVENISLSVFMIELFVFSAKVIGDFISEQFENYLKEELKIKRCLELYDDTRIHVCLYFISPTGHGYEFCLLWMILESVDISKNILSHTFAEK